MQPKRDKLQKCIANFSLYANIAVDRPEDPLEEPDPNNKEPFKVKLSKSAKKRLRKQKKLKMSSFEKQLKLQIIKKKTKLDMKAIIKKINKL